MLFLDMRRRYSITLAALVGIIMTQHAQAEHFMDQWPQCPPMRTHPSKLCPPDETLIWTDCPKYWPGDKTIKVGPSALVSGYRTLPSTIDYERNDLNEDSSQISIVCNYGQHDKKYKYKYQLTLLPQHPVVQCGGHQTSEGLLMGCSSPKTLVDSDSQRIFIPEQITDKTNLEGLRLGLSPEEVDTITQDKTFTKNWVKSGSPAEFMNTGYSLYGQGASLKLIFTSSSPQIVSEIILSDGPDNSETDRLFRIAVQKFGFEFDTGHAINDNNTIFIWTSIDKKNVVTFWPKYYPRTHSSLHLLDSRTPYSIESRE